MLTSATVVCSAVKTSDHQKFGQGLALVLILTIFLVLKSGSPAQGMGVILFVSSYLGTPNPRTKILAIGFPPRRPGAARSMPKELGPRVLGPAPGPMPPFWACARAVPGPMGPGRAKPIEQQGLPSGFGVAQ